MPVDCVGMCGQGFLDSGTVSLETSSWCGPHTESRSDTKCLRGVVLHGHAGIYPAAIALPKTRDTACRVRRERQAFFHLCVRPRLTVGRRWAFLALRTCQQYPVTIRRLTKTTPLRELLVLGTNACEAWIISRVRCSVICRQRRGWES